MNKLVIIIVCVLIVSTFGIAGCLQFSVKKSETKEYTEGNITRNANLQEEHVTTDEGNSGTVTIPWINPGGIRETHIKHHWDMPGEVVKVIATLNWEDTSWEFKYSIGTGECPDSGEQLNESTAESDGEIIVEYTNYDASPLEEGQWFVHIETVNENEHRGGSCDYTITITIYYPA